MTRINIEIKDDLHKQAKLRALLENKTLIKFIHEAIEEKLKKSKK
jgi:predicted HicB family RNase H-like nuclease